MPKHINQPNSLIDEMYDEFLKLLKDSRGFDDDLLDKLALLVKKGDMQKHQQVIKILKDSVGAEK